MGLRDQGMIRGAGVFGRRATGIITDPTGLLLPRTPVHRNRVQYAGAPDVLFRASAWYSNRDIVTGAEQALPNRANRVAASALVGSTSGVDTNDPRIVTWPGYTYIWTPGVANNGIQTTGSSTPAHTGAATSTFVLGRYNPVSTGGVQNCSMFATNSGNVVFTLSPTALVVTTVNDGTSGNQTLTYSLANIDALATWIEITITWATGACLARYSTSTTPLESAVIWTSLGSQTFAAVPRVPAAAGWTNVSAQPPAGGIHYARVASDTGGNLLIIDTKTEAVGQSTWTCTTGQTVSVFRTTTGLHTAVVTEPLWMPDGTDDGILQPVTDLPSHVTPSAGEFTILVRQRSWGNGGISKALWSSGSGSFEGLTMYEGGGASVTMTARDSGAGAVTRAVTGGGADGVARSKAGIFTGGTIRPWASGIATTAALSTAALANINYGTQPRVCSQDGNSFSSLGRQGEYFDVVQWNLALTDDELNAVHSFLSGPHS